VVVGVYAQQTGKLPGCSAQTQSKLSLSWRGLPHAECSAVYNGTRLPFVEYIKIPNLYIVNYDD